MTKLTAKAKILLQRKGVKFGCYADLALDEEPDGCVKDYGADSDCIFAANHRTREGCQYWREVKSVENNPYDAEILRLREENEKLCGLLREAHVKMVENDLWRNLRARIAAALRETSDD